MLYKKNQMMLLNKKTIKLKAKFARQIKHNLAKVAMLMLVVVSFSCSSELDLYPSNAIAPDALQESDLAALRLGMYSQVQNDPGRESFIMFDILGGLFQNSANNPLALINGNLSPLSSTVSNSWAGYYSALYQVNNVLSITKNLSDTALKTKTEGEAHFFRAYIYSCLVTRWGAVPILKENTMDEVARDSESDVWAFINEELELAESFLDNNNADYYYVSKNAVIALKARVALYQGNMDLAKENAEYLITQSGHQLDAFSKIFRKASNTEIIFAFENNSEESSITISTLFYSYAHPNKGSWSYRPSKELMELYSDDDLRKDGSITTIDGNDMMNKYPSGQTGTDPVIISRLAEMYLISAEAQGLTNGLSRLNELRKKRGLANINPSSEEAFIDAILLERKKELLGESFLYYDLVRTNKAVEELGILEYQTLLPIPGEELLLNTNLTPNPGY